MEVRMMTSVEVAFTRHDICFLNPLFPFRHRMPHKTYWAFHNGIFVKLSQYLYTRTNTLVSLRGVTGQPKGSIGFGRVTLLRPPRWSNCGMNRSQAEVCLLCVRISSACILPYHIIAPPPPFYHVYTCAVPSMRASVVGLYQCSRLLSV